MKRILKHTGFTLIELLTVIVIIVILAGLVLSVAGFVQRKGATARAEAEIKGMEAALESYKADNGAYPDDGTTSGSNTYVSGTCANLNAKTMGSPLKTYANNTTYSAASLVLYRALSGDYNCDGSVSDGSNGMAADGNYDITGAAVGSGTTKPTVYFPFKPGQLKTANNSTTINSTNKVTAIADPFGYSYGFSTAYAGYILQSGTSTPTPGYNPTYDLWSTTGKLVDPPGSGTDTVTPVWIKNW